LTVKHRREQPMYRLTRRGDALVAFLVVVLVIAGLWWALWQGQQWKQERTQQHEQGEK
jgi:type II secretory pathway component PulM